VQPFILPIQLSEPAEKINYRQPVLLTGSCFTEHIGNHLRDMKFSVLQNPHGILFDPLSTAGSLISYIEKKEYRSGDLIFLNECWQSWQHHSIFSNTDEAGALQKINRSIGEAQAFLKTANWLIITLGSAFSYRLKENQQPVANCHRAPADWFEKRLLTIEEMHSVLDNCVHRLFHFNPQLNIIFTVSPVRHIRDGVIENNRSKARLIEVVHHLVHKFNRIHYFAAYELVIDVLRDYRFYDIDLVHPNYQATEFVLEKFSETFIDQESNELMKELRKIVIARRHKPFQADTNAHREFLQSQFRKASQLQQRFPFLDLKEELDYFSGS
jgi:GSCFA family